MTKKKVNNDKTSFLFLFIFDETESTCPTKQINGLSWSVNTARSCIQECPLNMQRGSYILYLNSLSSFIYNSNVSG